MIIGSCWVDLHIPGARSLKDKRRVIKSLKERLKNRYNISIAETGALDKWQRAEIGIVCVSNDSVKVSRTLNTVMDRIRDDYAVSVIDYHTELI